MEKNINWNDNIKPELNAACGAVAKKAFENAKYLIEQHKKYNCAIGETDFGIVLGHKFFKGMAISAKLEFDELMRKEGYEAVPVVAKKNIWVGTVISTMYVPKELFERAQVMWNGGCYRNVGEYLKAYYGDKMSWHK